MGDEKGIKRYEPYGFLLALGMFSMLVAMLFALYKFTRNLKAGILLLPELGLMVYAGLAILILALIFLALSERFFRLQRFRTFRVCLVGSFGAGLLFVIFQTASLPMRKAGPDPAQQGHYYFVFLSAIHLLFVLAGVLANGVWLARVYRRRDYVETFIFSVNPPNILTMKLLVRYMTFVTILWAAVIIYLRGHAA